MVSYPILKICSETIDSYLLSPLDRKVKDEKNPFDLKIHLINEGKFPASRVRE